MPAQPICHFPDSVLRKPCEPVRHFDPHLQTIKKDLIATMKSQPHGIGIAAPQIGIAKQIAIIDVSSRVPEAKSLVLINPKILELKDESASREGCMSLPDYRANLKRYQQVYLSWQDMDGKPHQKWFRGIEAVCIQHEVDHLAGILFIDRVASLKRDLIPRPKP